MITGGAADDDTIWWAQPLWVNILFAQRYQRPILRTWRG